jgi:hypothetical protein
VWPVACHWIGMTTAARFAIIATVVWGAAIAKPADIVPVQMSLKNPNAHIAPAGTLTADEQKRLAAKINSMTPKQRKQLAKAMKKMTPAQQQQFSASVKRQLHAEKAH